MQKNKWHYLEIREFGAGYEPSGGLRRSSRSFKGIRTQCASEKLPQPVFNIYRPDEGIWS